MSGVLCMQRQSVGKVQSGSGPFLAAPRGAIDSGAVAVIALAVIGAGLDGQARHDPADHQRHQNDVINPAQERDQIGNQIKRVHQIERHERSGGLEVERCFGGKESLPELDNFLADKWSVLAQVQDRADHIIAYQRLMSPSGALSCDHASVTLLF